MKKLMNGKYPALYKVTFEFLTSTPWRAHDWKADYFSNNGEGFTLREAEETADGLKGRPDVRSIKIELLEA